MSNSIESAFGGSSRGISPAISIENEMKDDDMPEMWTTKPFSSSNALHKGLQSIEEILRCAVCQELMHIPVSLLPCHHTFCNKCIRDFDRSRRLNGSKSWCPTCRADLGQDISRRLVNNPSLEAMVNHYKTIRASLRQALLKAVSNGEKEASETKNEERQESSSATNSNATSSNNDTDMDDTENYYNGEADDDQDNNDNGEDCVEVLQSRNSNENTAFIRRKTKAKISYKGKRKKQLIELCRQEQLPTTGTEDELKARHIAFITLYNAECDSINPRDHATSVKVVMQEERERKKAASMHKVDDDCIGELKRNREEMGKSDTNDIVIASSGNEEFDKKLNAGFSALIEEHKKRMLKKPKPSPPSSNDDTKEKQSNDINLTPATVGVHSTSVEMAAACSTMQSSTTKTPIVNPYRKNGSSNWSIKSTAPPSASSFSDSARVETPVEVPNIFTSASQAPSTISYKQSQSFLASSQDPAENILGIAKEGATSSPNNAAHTVAADHMIDCDKNPSSANHEEYSNSAVGATAATMTSNMTEDKRARHERAVAHALSGTSSASSKGKIALAAMLTKEPWSRRNDVPQLPPARRSARSICGPWKCSRCTFMNEKRNYSTALCEMCNYPRSRNGLVDV